jgi:chorismate lyase / 3-hydroxybenzoate synthase
MAAVERAIAGPRVEFLRSNVPALDDDVLAALVYGAAQPRTQDPRFIDVGFATADGAPAVEIWRAPGVVATGRSGDICFSGDSELMFGSLDLLEQEHGGLQEAAEVAYRKLLEFQLRQPQHHLLRIWNHIHAINEGDGDLERYRQFCIGRSRGLGAMEREHLPAGTAVGRRDRAGLLQVCWLAGRQPGRPVGNPRQVHAYEYPRQYGPTPPSFSRAMLLPSGELIVSGTASIVGHESLHSGNLEAQIDETLTNLRELCRAVDRMIPRSPRVDCDDAAVAVKVYLRCRDSVPMDRILSGLKGISSLLLLEADICRKELLVEIECAWA